MTTDVTEPPELLWHYTGFAAFNSIVTSRELWATHHAFMNDRKEFTDGLQIIEDYAIKTDHGSLGGVVRAQVTSPAFVACFSKNPDQLGLWSLYGEAGGVALGFRREVLLNRVRNFSPNGNPNELATELSEVIYSEERFRSTVAQVFRPNASVHDYRAMHLAASYKRRDWETEEEWRATVLMYMSTVETWCYRSTKLGLVPFVKIPLGAASEFAQVLAKVRVGPSPYNDERCQSVNLRLESAGLGLVEVDASGVEYR